MKYCQQLKILHVSGCVTKESTPTKKESYSISYLFIPNTSRSDERQQAFQNQSDLDNLERWVLNHIGSGNRNDQIYKYAMVLADAGKSLEQIGELARSLNNKLSDRLSDEEIMNTVLKSVSNKMNRK